MNNKKVQKLLEALIDKTGNSDIDGLIRRMEYIVRETEELIDGYNTQKPFIY